MHSEFYSRNHLFITVVRTFFLIDLISTSFSLFTTNIVIMNENASITYEYSANRVNKSRIEIYKLNY